MDFFRVEVFDCPETGISIQPDRTSADKHRQWLLDNRVNAANIRIVKIDESGFLRL